MNLRMDKRNKTEFALLNLNLFAAHIKHSMFSSNFEYPELEDLPTDSPHGFVTTFVKRSNFEELPLHKEICGLLCRSFTNDWNASLTKLTL